MKGKSMTQTNSTTGHTCGTKCEVYSRVCGYFRPVSNWNKGKQEEFQNRKTFDVKPPKEKNCCEG